MGHTSSKSQKHERSSDFHHDYWEGDLVPERSHLRLDEFLFNIFQWQPEWLHNKQYNSKPPPQIVASSTLISTPLYYETFNEYCGAMMPLLLHEFWHVLKKDVEIKADSRNLNNSDKPRVITALLEPSSLRPTTTAADGNDDRKMSILKFTEVVEQTEGYPLRGDLIIFKHGQQEIFGYIEEISRNRVPNDKKWTIRYTVKTKNINIETWNSGRLTLSTVLPLGPYLRFVRAMEDLSNSPLFQSVMRPKTEGYELYHVESSRIQQQQQSLVTGHQLNSRQTEVVARVLETVERGGAKIGLIQGPPGTGKSRVILNIVCEILKSNKNIKILLCAPSNRAIDEIVSNLIDVQKMLEGNVSDFTMVRIGREEKMGESVKEVTLSFHTKMSRTGLRNSSSNCYRRQAEDEILKDADIIATTLSSCYTWQMENLFSQSGLKIPVCIVDEAAQATELGTLIPLMLGVKTLILVGDPKQLPPTILSEEAKFHGLDQSLFCRAKKNLENEDGSVNPIIMLDTQYRMVEELIRWPSNFFYRGALNTATVISLPLPFHHYRFLHHFAHHNENESNPGEAKLIVNLIIGIVRRLAEDSQYENVSIGIITPYQKQKRLIMSLLAESSREYAPKATSSSSSSTIIDEKNMDSNFNDISLHISNVHATSNDSRSSSSSSGDKQNEVGIKPVGAECTVLEEAQPFYLKLKSIQVNTVDSFQGQERDIIIMSCVRSRGIGFVGDPNRLCVSLTRAKHTLIVCGNFNIFKRNSMWNSLIADAEARRAYVKVNENLSPEALMKYIRTEKSN